MYYKVRYMKDGIEKCIIQVRYMKDGIEKCIIQVRYMVIDKTDSFGRMV